MIATQRFKFIKTIDILGIINVIKSISQFELFWVFLFLVNNRPITQKSVNLKQIYCCKNNGRKRYDLESLQNNFLIFAFIWSLKLHFIHSYLDITTPEVVTPIFR